MNKTQLVDALAARIGDRRTAATLVDGLIETIVDTVRAGDSVSLSGFGVFESRARAARVARNPRTGETVDVAATTVPAFRAGLAFRTAVGGGQPAAQPPARRTRTAAAAAPAAATEAAAVADAPAKVARGRSALAAIPKAPPAASKPGKKASAKKAAAGEKPDKASAKSKKDEKDEKRKSKKAKKAKK